MGDHSEPFLLFDYFCGTPPSCLKVVGWVGWVLWVAHKIIETALSPNSSFHYITDISSMLLLRRVKSFCMEAVMEMRTDFFKLQVATKPAQTHKILRRNLKRRGNLLILRLASAAGRFTRGGNCFMILQRLSYMAL